MNTDKLMRSTPGFDRSKVPEYTKNEMAVIRHIRTMGYGDLVVKVKEGQPVHLNENKSIKLD